ncbi:MAG: hypothetical protein JXA21_04320 [Anaerolineae bacterium]|nr:hypothetical protein [Anaerolineae bacterium]
MMLVAIVGLDAYFGDCCDVQGFARAVVHGLRCAAAPGALDGMELALRVADRALFDAGMERGERVAVVWAGDAPFADEIVALWDFSGPALDVSEGYMALAEAQRLLVSGGMDAVLIGETAASGGVAFVLVTSDPAPGRAYAVIEDRFETLPPAVIPGYWERRSLLEEALPSLAGAPEPVCALGSVRTNLGGGSLPVLAALARTALCLYHRVIPATPDWSDMQLARDFAPGSFYVTSQAQPWLVDGHARRVACVEIAPSFSLLLSEPDAPLDVPVLRAYMSARPFYLLPLAANGRDDLPARMSALRQQIAQAHSLDALADDAMAVYRSQCDAPYALSLLGHDRDELLRELEFAVKGVEKAFDTGQDWVSPLGSAFTAHPQKRAGEVAFVYPGAFNSYVGMGRDLFQLFPHLHARFAGVTQHFSRATAERFLYPRSLAPLSEADLLAAAARLRDNPTAMIESGASFAILYTAVMREVFGVQPAAALGYSLGEISMLWALGVWNDGDAGSDAWNATPLFKTRLFGLQEAACEYWHLQPDAGDAVWCSFILKAPVERVRQALEGESRVYLTIINEAKEVVIAGHFEDCARVIATLGCHALRVPFDAAIHAPVVRSEYAAFADLYSLPIQAVCGVDFYSAADYAPLTLEHPALARALAEMTCEPVDFPRLVQAAYDAGARIFVELGPLSTCSRWIGRILQGHPHAAVSINKSGKSDYDSFLPVLALLLTHRVSLNLSALSRTNDATKSQPALQPLPSKIQNPKFEIHPLSLQLARCTAEGHIAFLRARQTALQQTAELIAMQVSAAERMMRAVEGENHESRIMNRRTGEPASQRITNYESRTSLPSLHPPSTVCRLPSTSPKSNIQNPKFTESQLRAFGTGDLVQAFGPAYARYQGRRIPRLPNGDLLCMSRVLWIDGAQNEIAPGATLLSEFDVPANAWFYRGRDSLPTSLLMEIALQPCGVLSNYVGSILPYPDVDFYFRNLDGEGECLADVDVRGKTITNRVTLLNSTALQGIILQKFSFELACAGAVFYRGASSFGYFAPEALQRQAGLDGGQPRRPWLFATRDGGTEVFPDFIPVPGTGPLEFLDRVWYSPEGGAHGRGYVYAESPVSPNDWFFRCHFYQDPVMPGSLGVEAMIQAMQMYALDQGLDRGLTTPRFAPLPGLMTWKYRGQVAPESRRLHMEVHLSDIIAKPREILLTGDASLWKGDLRIYAVQGLGVRLVGR